MGHFSSYHYGGGSSDRTAPSPAPSALVTAITSTGFSVTLSSVSGESSTTVRIQTRPLGGFAAWTTRASSSSPVPGTVLSATGLTTGSPYEWRVEEEDALVNQGDGTHGIVTPSSSIWPTLLDTISTVLTNAGFTVYRGEAMPANFPALAALMRTRPEAKRLVGNGVAELDYPVEVEMRLTETSDTGEQRTEDVGTYQRSTLASFDGKGAETYPSIPGLSIVNSAVLTKDASTSGADEYDDLTVARMTITFTIVEARS